MTRRISLVVVAVLLGSFAFGVAISGAASTTKSKTKVKTKTIKVTKVVKTKVRVKASCKIGLTAIPGTGVDPTPPVDSGSMFGPADCAAIGKGLAGFAFVTADSGDYVGPFALDLGTGSLSGTADLSETSSLPPTAYSFGNADLSGTFKITGAKGTLKGFKGSGTFTDCTTPDSVAYACALTIKGKQTVLKTVTVTKTVKA